MATSQRVQLLTNKSEEISALVEFLRNPNLILELEAEVKKLNSLTEEEEARLHEAKILIQRKDSLEKEIKAKEDQMAAEATAHANRLLEDRKVVDKYVLDEKAKIADALKELDQKKLDADDRETKLRQYENKLKETAAKMKGLVGE